MAQLRSKKWLTRLLGLGTLVVGLIALAIARARMADAKEEVTVVDNDTRNVAIVLWEGVELLDFAGPGEVFAAAAHEGADRGHPAFRVYTVAPSKKPLKSQGFVTIVPEYGVDDAPLPDILVIPGGSSQILTEDPNFMRWAKGAIANAKVTLTVCTGAFVPANLGILDGLSATTHYSALGRLRAQASKTTVIDGKRFVDNGAIITSAGVSAGIDGALHTVARLLGRRVADNTARYMEYHWTPEAYLSSSYSYLNPSFDDHGRALQQAEVYEEAKDFAQAEKSYRALIEDYPKDGWGWYGLARVLHAKGEWDRAIEAGERAAKFARVRADALFTVACASARKGTSADALAKLRLAVEAGFQRKWQIEQSADLAGLRGDPGYDEIVKAL
jgi:putative intracellular protease/amidase